MVNRCNLRGDNRKLQFVVFVQDGETVDELENIYHNGNVTIVQYMREWDYGEYTEEPETACKIDESTGDGTYYEEDNYIVFRQLGGLNYSLYRILDA